CAVRRTCGAPPAHIPSTRPTRARWCTSSCPRRTSPSRVRRAVPSRSGTESSDIARLELHELRPTEVDDAAALLGRVMRDNPLNVRVFGPDPERRRKALTSMFGPVLVQYLGRGAVLGAFDGDALVGVCGMLAPGCCQPTLAEKLRLLPGLLIRAGPS